MEKATKEIVRFVQELVRIPSQNGINPEKALAKFIFEKLKGFGFSPKMIGSKTRPSVVCFLKKPKAKKTIWLESHIDTVPTGRLSQWKYPPFQGKILGEKMYGRGVADSKIGISIFSYLAKEFYENPQFQGNIFLGFDADEESGNFTGFKQILKQAPKSDVLILGYQGRRKIYIGARGWLRFRLITLGKAAHTGSRKKVINAIHKMQKAIIYILDLPFLRQKERFFEYGASLNVSLIKGGRVINVVPDKCEAIIDVRILPSQEPKMILKEIKAKLREIKRKDKEFNFKIELLQTKNAFLTNPNHAFLKILKKNAEKVLKRKLDFSAAGGGSHGNLIGKKIAVLNSFGCKKGNVHAPNEWIDISDIPKIFEIYQKSLVEFIKK